VKGLYIFMRKSHKSNPTSMRAFVPETLILSSAHQRSISFSVWISWMLQLQFFFPICRAGGVHYMYIWDLGLSEDLNSQQNFITRMVIFRLSQVEPTCLHFHIIGAISIHTINKNCFKNNKERVSKALLIWVNKKKHLLY